MLIVDVAVTFSRGQLLTFDAQPTAGKLTVAGATTGNGTVTGTGAAWGADTMKIGQYAANNYCFGRFSPTLVGL